MLEASLKITLFPILHKITTYNRIDIYILQLVNENVDIKFSAHYAFLE
jgi:hypothetical protein